MKWKEANAQRTNSAREWKRKMKKRSSKIQCKCKGILVMTKSWKTENNWEKTRFEVGTKASDLIVVRPNTTSTEEEDTPTTMNFISQI